MKESISERIKFTKRGKLIRRRMGQAHFRAKKNSKQIRLKRKNLLISPADVKMLKKYL